VRISPGAPKVEISTTGRRITAHSGAVLVRATAEASSTRPCARCWRAAQSGRSPDQGVTPGVPTPELNEAVARKSSNPANPRTGQHGSANSCLPRFVPLSWLIPRRTAAFPRGAEGGVHQGPSCGAAAGPEGSSARDAVWRILSGGDGAAGPAIATVAVLPAPTSVRRCRDEGCQ
jgi:hypothetical protein